jgi:histidine kinase
VQENRLLYESRNSRLLLAANEEYGTHVVKILNQEFPSAQSVKHFVNEFELLKDYDIPGIRKVLGRGKFQNHQAIFLEHIEGVTLRQLFGEEIPLVDKLKVAINLIQVIGNIHDHSIIHKDITPANILVETDTLNVVVIDFGISSRFSVKNQHLGNPKRLEGTLTYISPEQTGRMNRVVDYRTDIYSAGIVLYEFFCGQAPFVSDDAMTLVHSHIASEPAPIQQIAPELPQQLNAVLQKMLAKNAEDRYQSIQGLWHDLDRCREALEKEGSIPPFPVAEQDISTKFQLVQKLYGRDEEIHQLLEAYQRCTQGDMELIMVAGFSGTGKSSLVKEIYKPVTERRGYFVEGKFDQFQRSVPYFAFIQAFRSLVNLLLTEDEARLDYFRQKIQEAVGEEGAVLIEVIPELELILGAQPPVVEVGGTDAQNRFNYIFRRFLHALSSADHPLALFIDDLQWADSASLDLMEVLMTDPEGSHLLCIGAYRDNEVGASHPLNALLHTLREEHITIEEITIGNLNAGHVNDLIADSLRMDGQLTAPLADLVVEKTGGNAYFVTQFLNALNEDQLIQFDRSQNQWSWDMDTIRKRGLPDDVVLLMSGKIRRMSPETRKVLMLAACVGASFEISNLAVIAEESTEKLLKDLEPAFAEGLVYQDEELCRFSHDRVQQASYSLIPVEERNNLHLKIGRLILQNTSKEEQHDRIFDIVNQLNWGIEILTDEQEKQQLARLNWHAGRKAKDSSAFLPAHLYIQNGISLLKPDHWDSQYDLSIDLYSEAAETAFLCSQFEEMDRYIDTILEKARNLEEKIKPSETRIHALKAQNRLLDALQAGLQLMEQLGEKFPSRPSPLLVMPDLIKTSLMLRGKSNEELRDLPEVQDPIKRAAIRVLAGIAPSSYWGKPEMFPFLIFRMVQLSIRYGNSPISSFGFATYGVIMVGVLNLPKTGYRFGKLGASIVEKYHAKEWIAQIYTPVYALINIWNEHIRNTLKPLRDSYHVGLETGAIEFACINANIYCIQSYLIGLPLEKLEEETRDFSEQFKAFNQDTNFSYNEIFRQGMLNFLGQAEGSPTVLTGAAINEEQMLADSLESNNRTSAFQLYLNKMILCNFFGDYETAWKFAVKGRPLLDAVLAKLEVALFHFHEGLAAINTAESSSSSRRKLLGRARKDIRKMKGWAKHAPENFLHKWELLKAEYNRVAGNRGPVGKLYDQAIQHASESQYLHEEALAAELASRYQTASDRPNLARYYLRMAVQLYREWGADGKIQQLTEQAPEVVSSVFMATQRAGHGTKEGTIGVTTTIFEDGALDLATILKASTSISGEIQLDNLIRTLLKILLENLGATRGVLILQQNNELIIKAESVSGAAEGTEIKALSVKNSGLIPESLVAFVQRTKELINVDHAMGDPRFNQDAYIVQEQPCSVLGYPIINKGELVGILYFENELAEGAFTEQRMELLQMLSGQIAISIENALLYESLERKVEERTAMLAAEKEKSDQLLRNILPEETAEELKVHGKARPRRYEHVTVMFTDFKGFTRITEHMDPAELVTQIDHYFAAFDQIMDKYQLEKIKTIGDAYMCVGGLPKETDDHVVKVLKAAEEILQFMWKDKEQREQEGKPHFGIRIGIHTGPVVAGVVGLRKFAYDIWGDTVNTASRMESNSDVWKINVSGSTHDAVQDQFDFEYRGKIQAKNKGMIDMYYLNTPLSTHTE